MPSAKSLVCEIRVRWKWWLWIYLETLGAVCWLLGTEPDDEKVYGIVKRGVIAEMRIGGKWIDIEIWLAGKEARNG